MKSSLNSLLTATPTYCHSAANRQWLTQAYCGIPRSGLALIFLLTIMVVTGCTPMRQGLPAANFADRQPHGRSETIRADYLGTADAPPRDKMTPNGHFSVEVLRNGHWQEVGIAACDQFIREASLKLPPDMLSGTEINLRLTKHGGGAAHLDAVTIGGKPPVRMADRPQHSMQKLASRDFDLLDAVQPVELTFAARGELVIAGRIEPEVIGSNAFMVPRGNYCQDLSGGGASFIPYRLDTEPSDGKPEITLLENSRPFIRELLRSGSGHPSDYLTGWVRNDRDRLFVTLDFTGDNTLDGDKDFAKVFVRIGNRVREFKVTEFDSTWGQALFTYTAAVPWQHKLYEFNIPLAELAVQDRSVPLQLAFSTYGTCSPGDLSKSGPELAHDSANNRYLAVYKVRPNVLGGTCMTRVVGQLRNPNGSPAGPEFTVGPDFNLSSSAVALAAAFDTNNNRFLVIWNNDLGNLVGQLVNPDGSLNGAVQFVSASGQVDPGTLGLSFDPVNGRFLAAWQDRRDFASSDVNIYGQLLNADLTPFSPADTAVNFAISTAAGLQHRPKVSFEPTSGRFLVVWQDLAAGIYEIRGQLVNGSDGSLIASPFLIATSIYSQVNPDVSTDPVNSRFLVAWQDGFIGVNAPHASIVGSDGTVAPVVTINPTGGSNTAPRLAFNSTDLEFLATWQATTPTLAQKISATDGTPLAGTEVTILASTGTAPTTAYNSVCNNYLVAVEDSTANPTTIFYQAVGAPCFGDATPPSDGTLTVKSIDTTRIDLGWSGFADTGSGLAPTNTYTLVRANSSIPPTDCSGTPIYRGNATSFSDTGLAVSSQYAYRLCAADAAGNVSSGATVAALTLNPCVSAPSGLVSWWPANGNANDEVGSNSATMSNPASLTLGKVGQGFSFDGVNDYLRMTASPTLDVGTGNGFTLGAWIKPTNVANQQPLFEWSNGATGVHFWIAVPSPGTGAGSLYANIADSGGGGHVIASPPGILVADSYQHVALTYDKSTGQAEIYLNGVSVISQNLGIFTPRTDLHLFVGNRPGILKFAGAVDELQLYNRPLTAAEVSSTYNSGNGGLCSVPDTIPPVNGTLSASPASSTEIYLFWSGFSDARSGLATTNPYRLVRADATTTPPADCSTGTLVYQGNGTYLYDSLLTPNTAYAYRLCATDGAGNVSTGATATTTTRQVFTLTTATSGTGGASGTVSPPSGPYDAASYAYLYAYPDANSVFAFWSGDCSGTYPSTSVYFDTNKSCTANFAPIPAPQVTATVPASGGQIADVTTTAAITASFNVPLLQTSINAATVIVKDQNGVAVSGSITYDSYYNQITFTPATLLAGGATYTVTLTTGILNAIGSPLPSDYSWSFSVTPYLGGVASEGNLLITPLKDGRIGVYRLISGSWQQQVFSWDSKGSRLQVNGNGHSLGYFNLVEIDALPAFVANSQVSSTQTRTEWTTTDNLRLIQELTYQPGAAYYGLVWKISNEGTADVSDLRFFHGEDTYFLGSDRGAGFWDAPNTTVGVQRTYGSDLRRMSLQAVTSPFAYDSEYYGTVRDNVNAGALTSTIDPSESTDNGYALEWRSPILPVGATWSINAFEKFADVPVGAVFVTAPVTTSCTAGVTCDLTFSLTNTTTASATITLALAADQPGWSATTAATSLTIAAGGSQQVTVQLSTPANTSNGAIGHLTLAANDGTAVASDTAAIHVQNLAQVTLNTAQSGNGTGTIAPNQPGPYLAGTVVQLTASPATGSVFAGWGGDCSGTANPYSLTMDTNKSCTATFTLAGTTVSGTIYYTGTNTNSARIYISMHTPNGTLGTSVNWPSETTYTIRGVPNGTYTISAFMDILGIGSQVQMSPAGSTVTTVAGSAITGLNISLNDQPAPISPAAPLNVSVAPGDSSVMIGWDPPRVNGVEAADTYDIYWGTSSNLTTGTANGSKLNIPAGLDSPVVIDNNDDFVNISNGKTLYFVVIPKSGGVTGTASATIGPVTVNPTTGGNTVSGTVTYSGSTPTGPLYVILVDPLTKGINGAFYTKIANPSFSNSYSISGAPNGSYMVYTIIDMNNDGRFGVGDTGLTSNGAPVVNLSGSGAAGINLSLNEVNTEASITTNHGKPASGTGEWYYVNGEIGNQLKRAVKVALTGAPAYMQLSLPMDLGISGDGGRFSFWGGATSRPAIGDTFTLLVSYADATPDATITATVTGVLDSFPSSLTVSAPVTVPTFTWGAPSITPPANYLYSLWVGGATGGNMWEAWDIPSSITSMTYGSNGSTPQPLILNNTYSVTLGVKDQFGNQAQLNTSFTPTQTQSAAVINYAGVFHSTKSDGSQWDVLNLGTTSLATSIGSMTASVSGPNGFIYTFTDADKDPYVGNQLSFVKQYDSSTSPLAPGLYTFTFTDSLGNVSHRVDSHVASLPALPIVDSTTIQTQRKADGSYRVTWAPVSAAPGYFYRVRLQKGDGSNLPVYFSTRDMSKYADIPATSIVDGTAYQIRIELCDAPTFDLMFNRSASAFVGFTPQSTDYDANKLLFTYSTVYNRFEADGSQVYAFGFGVSNAAQVTAATVTGPGGFSYSFQPADLLQPNAVDFYKSFPSTDPTVLPGRYTFSVVANGATITSYATLNIPTSYPLPDPATYQAEAQSNGDVLFSWGGINRPGALFYRVFITDISTGRYMTTQRNFSTNATITAASLTALGTGDKKWRVEVFDGASTAATPVTDGTYSNRVNGAYTAAPFPLQAYDAGRPLFNSFSIYNETGGNGAAYSSIAVSATDPDGTVTGIRVDGPNGYLRNLLTQGKLSGSAYTINEPGSLASGLYTITVTDNSGKTAVRYHFQPTSLPVPAVNFKSFVMDNEPSGNVRISWAPVYSGNMLWYSLQFYANADTNNDGMPDTLFTNPFSSTTSVSITSSQLLTINPAMLRIAAANGNNGTNTSNISQSDFTGYQGAGINYAALTDSDNDGFASNIDPNDNSPLSFPFAPPFASGNITYSGSKTGTIYISVDTPQGVMGTSIPAKGTYAIRGLPNGTFPVSVFMDHLNLGTRVQTSPAGSSTVTVSGASVTLPDINLTDSTAVAPPAPVNVTASAGDKSVIIDWDKDRPNGIESADSYDIYWGPTAAVNSTSFLGKRSGIPAGFDSPAVVDGLTNGDKLYFVVTASSGGLQSGVSQPFGPVTVGTATGGNTVSGTLNYTGQTATGPLYIAVVSPVSKGAKGIYYTTIAAPAASNNFTITGVPDGDYVIYSIIDMNNDKLFGIGDVMTPDNKAPMVTVAGAPVSALSLSLAAMGSESSIRTDHHFAGPSEFFNIEGEIRGQLKRPVAATLTSAPAGYNFTLPMDLGLDTRNSGSSNFRFWSGSPNRPNVGDSFTLSVTYSDGSTDNTVTASVTGVNDSFPTNPQVTAPVTTVPTFSWEAPVTPPANYRYSLYVWTNSSNGIWDAWDLPNSMTSVVYGSTGSTPQPLQTGITYNWNVSTLDKDGNRASVSNSFVPTQAGAPLISWPVPAPIIYGSPLSAAELNASSQVPGSFSYSPAAGTVLSAGAQTLTVTFSPTDSVNYLTATATVNLTVNQVTPVITWVAPAAITSLTPLSATQLNATASVPGTFSYSPASGTLLAAGTQALNVTFTPTDSVNYAVATASVNITVNLPSFPITALASTGGSISPPGVTSVLSGTTQAYAITANTGYHIADVKIDGVSQGAIAAYSFTSVAAGHTIDATFAVDTFIITATANSGGSVSPTGATTLNYGASQGYTITPDAGFVLVDVKVDQTSAGKINGYTFNNITAGHTIEAVFGADGVIDPSNTSGVPALGDALIVLTAALGDTTLTPAQIKKVDTAPMINGVPQPDGKVDLLDVLMVLRRVVGLEKW